MRSGAARTLSSLSPRASPLSSSSRATRDAESRRALAFSPSLSRRYSSYFVLFLQLFVENYVLKAAGRAAPATAGKAAAKPAPALAAPAPAARPAESG